MDKQILKLVIPDDVKFEDLQLAFDDEGGTSFNWQPIEHICHVNGVSLDVFKRSHEDNVSGLIVGWYVKHCEAGGAQDSVMEEVFAEVLAEERQRRWGGGVTDAASPQSH